MTRLNQPEIPSQSGDSIRSFMLAMGRFPLLEAHEEIELGRVIQANLAIMEKLHSPTAAKQCPEYLGAQRQMLAAKQRMINCNLRLVVSVAKKYQKRGLEFQVLIQEGAIGLARAAELYDPSKGFKFSTYSYWWIRQAISRAVLNDADEIRLPIHMSEKINRVKKATNILRQELNRLPTKLEIADRLEMTVDQVEAILASKPRTISLHIKVGKEEDTELGYLLEDTSFPKPEDIIQGEFDRAELEAMSRCLTPNEWTIVKLRFGVDDGTERTLAEVGRVMNMSRERVRQIQQKAMRKLKARAKAKSQYGDR